MEDDAQLAIMGVTPTPSRLYLKRQHPTGPLCRVCVYRLSATRLHTEAADMFGRQTAVCELTDGVDYMSVLARNMKEMERRVSSTSHAIVLLMHSEIHTPVVG